MVAWYDQFSQAGELIVDGRPGDHGAHDKLRDTNLHKGVDTAQDSIGRAPGGVGLEGDAWINALHQRGDLRTDVLVAKVKGDDSPVMVLWDSPLVLLSSLANGAHGLAGFLWGLVGAEETVSQTRYAFVGRRGASTKPHRNRLLLGLGIDGEFVRVVELAGVCDRVFTPYAAHQGHGFIGHGAALPRRAAHSEPLGIVIDTQSEGWQHATVAEEINGSDFFRQHQRVTHGQDGDAHAKFDALRPARDHGQAGNGFKGWGGIADAVVEPDRIEPAFFDQINKIPKIFSAREGPATEAYADTDFHRDLPVVKNRY